MINPARTVVVVNPAAAGGRVGRNWTSHERMLRRHLGDCAFAHSRESGHATELAEQAVRDGAETVLSLGGDGTHNEVVNGLMQAGETRVRFGVLPAGTGGDFRRLLVHGGTLEESARGLSRAEATSIDVGRAQFRTDAGDQASRFFLNIASCGASGLVDRIVNRSKKRLGGSATFAFATLQALREYRPARVRLTVDGRECGEHEISTITVCNGRYAGGGMHLAPGARLADGQLDVVVIRKASLLTAVTQGWRLYQGTHLETPLAQLFRGRTVRIEPLTEHPTYVDIDGESPGVAPIEFEIRPSALTVLGLRHDAV